MSNPTLHAPSVTIVVPAYNVTPFIGDALTSVFAQTFTDYEVVVVNDGCPDTANLERALEPYRGRIRYIRQPNGGPSAARNTAVQHARGELIALLDADDAYLPRYLERQVAWFRADPSLDLVYPDMEYFGGSAGGRTVMDVTPQKEAVTFESLVRQDCTVLNCAMARRHAILEAGGWDPAMRHAEDYDLWLRMALRGSRMAYYREPLARLRLREGSLSSDSEPMFRGQLTAYGKLVRTGTLTAEQRRLVEHMIAVVSAERDVELGKRAFASGEYREAAARLSSANRVLHRTKLSLASAALTVAPRAFAAMDRVRRRLLHGARA